MFATSRLTKSMTIIFSQKSKMNQVLCPKIADEDFIITADNMDALLLSNYERTPGTKVYIRCLSNLTHRLRGAGYITCLPSGDWDSEIPKCVSNKLHFQGDVVFTTQAPKPPLAESDTYEMLPYLVGLVIIAIVIILFMILFTYAMRMRRRADDSVDTSMLYDSSMSSVPPSKETTAFWVDMANTRNFRCHELAQSRDVMVKNLRYTQLAPNWSGY